MRDTWLGFNRLARVQIDLLLACLLACCMPWGGACAETLPQVLARVYQASPQLNADRARQRAEDENVPRTPSGYYPNVSATGEFGPT